MDTVCWQRTSLLSRSYASRVVVLGAAICLISQQAHAQEAVSASLERKTCAIEAMDEEPEVKAEGLSPAPFVVARCSGTGFVLGQADRHEVFSNPGLGVQVVVLEHLGRTRVMSLTQGSERVLVEDISGSLAVAAGRTPTQGMRGLVINMAAFAARGAIGVAEAASDGAAGGPVSGEFSMAEHVEQVQAHEAAVLTEGAEVEQ